MSNIKNVAGIWIPATEEHLLPFLAAGAKRSASGEGSYQLHTLSAFVDHVPSDRRRVVVDIGGNVGLWSMHFSRLFNKVIAYEPVPINQECFALNTYKHPTRPTRNVELRYVALGATPGEVTMEYDGEVSSGTHVASDDLSKRKNNATFIRVPQITLDSERLATVDAIKIDVEGYELPVLQGAENTIRTHKPVICIEQKPWDVFPWDQYDAVKLLMSWGAKPVQRVVDDFVLKWD